MPEREFLHGEAYMRMRYRCERCHNLEVVWNSEDQVTPFTIDCPRPICPGHASHERWRDDVRATMHVPQLGERVFVRPNPESLLEKAHEYVERHWEQGSSVPMKDHPLFASMGKEAAAVWFVEEWMKDGTPQLVAVTQPLKAAFLQRAAQMANRGAGQVR